MDKRPDLPALDRVETRAGNLLIVIFTYAAISLLFMGLCAWSYLKYRTYFGDQLPLVAVIVGLMVLLGLWLAFRMLTGDYFWSTDDVGLTVRGPLRRRTIKWADVTEAVSSTDSLRVFSYNLRTPAVRITIPDYRESASDSLYASIWQHLRRCGKAGELELPLSALTFWDRIPDELPREVDWDTRMPKSAWANVAVPAAAEIAALWMAVSFALNGTLFPASLLAVMAVGLGLLLRMLMAELANQAWSVILMEDSIEARLLRRTVNIPWSSVVSAGWYSVGNYRKNIRIRSSVSGKELLIPFLPNDERSGKLILAIIRRLRTSDRPQALSIPKELRVSNKPPISVSASHLEYHPNDYVELRLATWEKALGSVMISIIVVFVTFGLFFPHAGITLCMKIGLVVAVVTWLAMSIFVKRLDSDGISTRFLCWKKSVSWDRVHDVVFIQRPGEPSKPIRRLVDSEDRSLIDVTPDIGDKRHQEAYLSYLEAKLPVVPEKPWLARPQDMEG